MEVTDISGLAASPDGTTVAFRTEAAALDANTYRLRWLAAELGTGMVRDLGGGGDPVYAEPGAVRTEAAFWAPDGKHVFYRALVDGRLGLWRAAADGSGAAVAFEGEANIEAVSPADDGQTLLLRFGPTRDEIARAERGEYDEGILVDRHVDLGQSVFRGAFVDGRKASQRLTGYWFLRAGLLWELPRSTRRFDLATSTPSQQAEPLPPPAVPGPAAEADLVARSGPGDVATVTRSDALARLSVRRRGSAQTTPCDAVACRERIVALVWRPGHDQLLFTTQDERHDQKLYLWTVGAPSVRYVAGGQGLLGGGRDAKAPCAVTVRSAVCVSAAALSPPRLEQIDLDSGERRTLYDPNLALRDPPELSAETLEWTAPDGQKFNGVLFLPRHRLSGAMPLVIDYYVCDGYVRGGLGDELPFAPLASAGIAGLCINFVPAGGAQRAQANYEKGLGAIRAAIDLLARRGIVDRARIGIAGLSFGSEVAMWTAMRSDLLAAVSISSSQLEPGYYWMNAVRGRDQPAMLKRVWGLGAPDATPAAWRSLSPALNVDRIRAPVLMQLPEQEARDVVELYARLTNSSTPAELYVFPDEAHIKVLPRHKLAVYQRNLDWFRFWLQDHVDPDPARAEQYRRWRELAQRRVSLSQDRSQSSVAASSMIRK